MLAVEQDLEQARKENADLERDLERERRAKEQIESKLEIAEKERTNLRREVDSLRYVFYIYNIITIDQNITLILYNWKNCKNHFSLGMKYPI